MLGLVMIAAALGLIIRIAINQRSIAHSVLAAMIAIFYGLRAFGVGLGVDDPYPRYLFSATHLDYALDRFGLALLAFCISLAVGGYAFSGLANIVARALPFPRREMRLQPFVFAMVLFSALALAVALYQTTVYGGIQGSIVAAKSERTGGEGLLRIPATVALILSCAGFHAIPKMAAGRATQRLLRVVATGCMAASILSASLWGSRQFIVLALAYVFGAPAIRAFRHSQRGWWIKSSAIFAVVVAAGFALRLYRDDILGGETAVTAAEGDLFRQVSISANGTMLDSSLLAVKDFPAHSGYRAGEDFMTGLYGGLPSTLRPDDREIKTVGATFHQLYEPTANSGWPIGAPTEWYINFGWVGVVLGGLLSGLVYTAITVGMKRSSNAEFSTMVSLTLTLIVFPLGVSASSPNRFVIYVLPLILVTAALSFASRSVSSSRRRYHPQRVRAH